MMRVQLIVFIKPNKVVGFFMAHLLQEKIILSLAPNVPGPYLCYQLKKLGATIFKIESPEGDLMERAAPKIYQKWHEGVSIQKLDLKTPEGISGFHELIKNIDLLVTSSRPASLTRLGIHLDKLIEQLPKLNILQIHGFTQAEKADFPGHDLNFMAESKLLGEGLPKGLFADITGSLQGTIKAIELLLGEDRQAVCSLYDSLAPHRDFVKEKLTHEKGPLGGAHPGYDLYESADGKIALAALEKKFQEILCHEGKLESFSKENLTTYFKTQTNSYWREFALKHLIPLSIIES